jgi:beta-phosphoglucomutase-like phosphatase (HAD superfamily)
VDLHADFWARTFAHFGVDAKYEELRRHIGEGADRSCQYFCRKARRRPGKEKSKNFGQGCSRENISRKYSPFANVSGVV